MSNPFDREESPVQDLSFAYISDAMWRKSRISFAGSSGVRNPDGRFNNLGLMLSDECPWKTVIITENGNRAVLEGSVIKQYYDALEILGRIGRPPASRKYAIERYPKNILKEGVVNALAHRDYSDDTPVTITAGGETIEIWSPGGLWDPETDARGDLCNVRNSGIAKTFRTMEGFGFQGNGITSIKQFYKMSPQIPAAFFDDSSFTLTLPAISRLSSSYEVRRDKIVNILKTYRGMSASSIADLTLFSAQYIRRLLKRMEEEKLVFSTGSGRKNIYYLCDPDRFADPEPVKQKTLDEKYDSADR